MQQENNCSEFIFSPDSDIGQEIRTLMLPEELIKLNQINHFFHERLIKNNALWKFKYWKHFGEPKDLQNEEKDWYKLFWKEYGKQYRNIPKEQRYLYSLTKENQWEPLKAHLRKDPTLLLFQEKSTSSYDRYFTSDPLTKSTDLIEVVIEKKHPLILRGCFKKLATFFWSICFHVKFLANLMK